MRCAAAAYYTSFASVGLVVYVLRTRKGYRSFPEAINLRYGPLATLSFGAAAFFRLYQEVWSNAVVRCSPYVQDICMIWCPLVIMALVHEWGVQ